MNPLTHSLKIHHLIYPFGNKPIMRGKGMTGTSTGVRKRQSENRGSGQTEQVHYHLNPDYFPEPQPKKHTEKNIFSRMISRVTRFFNK